MHEKPAPAMTRCGLADAQEYKLAVSLKILCIDVNKKKVESRGAARLAPGLRPRLPAAAASPLPSTAAAERHHPGARASRPHPSSCKEPPVHGHSLAKRTKPAFTGFASLVPGFVRAGRPRSRGVLCGRDARAPGGAPFHRLHCLHRLIREGCQRNERCEKSLQRTSSAMEADGLLVHQQRSDASLIPGIHTNGKLCFWNESPTLTAYLGWSSPGSAGVPPASFFLQRASRPRPLPRKAHQTRLYGVRFPRARLCAGETPAFPGGLVRAGRPRSRGVFTPTPFPSLGRPVPNLLQPLRAPSWIIPYPPPASARRCRVASGSISRLPGRRTTP